MDGNQEHRRTLEGLHKKILDGTDVFHEHNNQDLTLNWDKITSADEHRKFAKEAKEEYSYLALVPRHVWSPWVHCEDGFLDTLFGDSTDENDHVPPRSFRSKPTTPQPSPQMPIAHRARLTSIKYITASVAFAVYIVVELALCDQAWMEWESWMSDGRVAADARWPIAR